MKCQRCNKLITDIQKFNTVSINTPALSKLKNVILCKNCKELFKTFLNQFMNEVRIYNVKNKIDTKHRMYVEPEFIKLEKELFNS